VPSRPVALRQYVHPSDADILEAMEKVRGTKLIGTMTMKGLDGATRRDRTGDLLITNRLRSKDQQLTPDAIGAYQVISSTTCRATSINRQQPVYAGRGHSIGHTLTPAFATPGTRRKTGENSP
jgi:hypothetical protein